MSIYDRNKGTGLPPNWWLYYFVTKELAQKFKLTQRRVREPAGVLTEAHAKRIEKDRKLQVRDGSWRPLESELVTFDWCMAQRLAACEEAKLSTTGDIRTRLTNHILPKLVGRAAKGVGPSDIEQVMRTVRAEHPELAPRTIIHIYEDMRMVFEWALTQDPPLIPTNPCKLKAGRGKTAAANSVLPRKRDKDPRWRRTAKFEVWEVEVMIAAPLELIPIDRLVFYALMLLTGSRIGEVCGLRVSDYDLRARPLPRLHIVDQGEDDEGGSVDLKGHANPREVPVHPILWDLLEYWLTHAFPALYGRPAEPMDFLVPSRKGASAMRSASHMYKKLQMDLERLGMERRSAHDARRGFISMLSEFKCDERVVKAITHEGVATDSAEVFRNYTIHNWASMCEEMYRVLLEPRPLPSSAEAQRTGKSSPYAFLGATERAKYERLPPLPRSTRATAGSGEGLGHRSGHSSNRGLRQGPEIAMDSGRGGRGSNQPPEANTAGNKPQERNGAPGIDAGSANNLDRRNNQATTAVALFEPALADDLRAAGDAIMSGRAHYLNADWRQRLAGACEQAAALLTPELSRERGKGAAS